MPDPTANTEVCLVAIDIGGKILRPGETFFNPATQQDTKILDFRIEGANLLLHLEDKTVVLITGPMAVYFQEVENETAKPIIAQG